MANWILQNYAPLWNAPKVKKFRKHTNFETLWFDMLNPYEYEETTW